MRVGSLFSGIGGFDLAFERAGGVGGGQDYGANKGTLVTPLRARSYSDTGGDEGALVPVTAAALNAERLDADRNERGTFVVDPMVMAVSENQRGELVETDVAHQLTVGGGKPGQGYSAIRAASGVRRLTPTECERLQGFPDGWTAGQADSTRYRQLGNAVAVPVVEWIARRLVATEA